MQQSPDNIYFIKIINAYVLIKVCSDGIRAYVGQESSRWYLGK